MKREFSLLRPRSFPPLLVWGLIIVLGATCFILLEMWNQNLALQEEMNRQKTFLKENSSQISVDEVAPVVTPDARDETLTVRATDHVFGKRDAEIIMFVYSDFDCPYCQAFYNISDDLLEIYGEKLAIVYRHFPLIAHPQAEPKARASECVAAALGEEGYVRYADILFTNTRLTGEVALATAAANLGADRMQILTCLADGTFKDRVRNELEEGRKAGVTGTPGIFITKEGRQTRAIMGALPLQNFQAILNGFLD